MSDAERHPVRTSSDIPSHVTEVLQTLSDEEQLSALPMMLDRALTGDKRNRVIHYLETLLVGAAPERSPFHVSRDTVRSFHAFSEEELALLTDEDVAHIGARMEAHFRQDWYAEEVVFHVQAMLDEKANASTS